MAQEGIATLPQAPENAALPPEVGVDASKNELLKQFGPEAMSEYESTMDQAAGQLNIPLEQLQQLQQIIEYVLKNYKNYPQIRQELLAQGIREEDLPPEFDAGYFGSMQVMVAEAIKRATGSAPQPMAQGPEMVPPEGSPLPAPQGLAKGGLAGAAESLRQKGRNGDTMLAHINPQEAQMLKRMGGSGTINPKTGLPEFFLGINLSDAWSSVKAVAAPVLKSPVAKIVGTVALAYALGPAGGALLSTPMAAAVAAGSVSALSGASLQDSLISAATGYGMAYLAPELSNMLPGAGNAATGVAPSFLNAVMTGGVMGTGYGLATGQNLQNSLKMGLTGGAIAGAANYLQSGPYAPKEGAPGAPITDNSQNVVLQPDGTYAPADIVSSVGPGGMSNNTALDLVNQGNVLTPNQVSATNFDDSFFNTNTPNSMENWLNQQPNTTFDNSLGRATQYDLRQPSSLQMPENMSDAYGPGWSEKGFNGGPSNSSASAPSSGGISDYYNQAKDYLFSSNPQDPGLFMTDKGSLSIPMVTGAVLAGGYLGGGFDSAPPSSPGVVERDENGNVITGSDLLEQDPGKYVYNPSITTGPVYDPNNPNSSPYSGNTNAPTDINTINTRQYGQARTTPYGAYTPPAMSGGITSGNTVGGIPQPYNTADMYDFLRPRRAYAAGGITQAYPRRTGGISGPGTGTSDSIPAMLSDGEFVLTAKAVKGAGGGSRREGAKKLYRMMHALEKKAK